MKTSDVGNLGKMRAESTVQEILCILKIQRTFRKRAMLARQRSHDRASSRREESDGESGVDSTQAARPPPVRLKASGPDSREGSPPRGPGGRPSQINAPPKRSPDSQVSRMAKSFESGGEKELV